MSEQVGDHVAGLIGSLIAAIGLDATEVLEFRVHPAAGHIDVTVLDSYRNVRCLKFHYVP